MAHLLLICRFDVNFLYKNPIIGQIRLVYIHFQQYFPYFSNYVIFYCAEICLPTAYFTSSPYMLKHGFPKFGFFFSKRRLIFGGVKAHPQLLQIFGHIAHGCYRARHQYVLLFTSSQCVLKCSFPKFGLFFSKRPAGFHCCKRPSPTFANIWSHCLWALQSTAPVYLCAS